MKVLSDLFKELRVLCFTEDLGGNLAKELGERYRRIFGAIENFVGDRGLVFGYLTLVDFYVAEVSHYVERILP